MTLRRGQRDGRDPSSRIPRPARRRALRRARWCLPEHQHQRPVDAAAEAVGRGVRVPLPQFLDHFGQARTIDELHGVVMKPAARSLRRRPARCPGAASSAAAWASSRNRASCLGSSPAASGSTFNATRRGSEICCSLVHDAHASPACARERSGSRPACRESHRQCRHHYLGLGLGQRHGSSIDPGWPASPSTAAACGAARLAQGRGRRARGDQPPRPPGALPATSSINRSTIGSDWLTGVGIR